jgi:hypothetical protein
VTSSGHFPRRLVLKQSWIVSPPRVITCWQPRPSIFRLLLVLTLHVHILPSAQLSMLRLGDRSWHSSEQRRVSHWEILMEFADCTEVGNCLPKKVVVPSMLFDCAPSVDRISTPGNHGTWYSCRPRTTIIWNTTPYDPASSGVRSSVASSWATHLGRRNGGFGLGMRCALRTPLGGFFQLAKEQRAVDSLLVPRAMVTLCQVLVFVPLSSYSGSQRVGSRLRNLPTWYKVYCTRTHHVRRQ